MFKSLFLALVLLPFLDLYVLVALGHEVGFWPIVGLVLASAVVGTWLAREEGLRVLRRWQESVARGLLPEEGLMSGVLVLAGGLLLVMPGVISDVLGLLLLFPPTRRLVARWVRRRLERGMAEGTVRVTTFHSSGPVPGAPFGPPLEDEPFAPPPSQPRFERGREDEVDAEFTEED